MRSRFKSKPNTLRQRVFAAAENVLTRDGAVGPIELLIDLRFLERVHFESWKRGNPHYSVLEDHIRCGKKKLADTFCHFRVWADEQGLEAAEAIYQGAGRSGAQSLQILVDDDPQQEKFLTTRFVNAGQTVARKEQIKRKLNKVPDLTVFVMTGEGAQCHECGEELTDGGWMFREQEQPLCLICADLDHLEFLPSGNATLSRRAKKFSILSAVVVKFNRRRKRYERQGLLATPEAIAQAEQSMEADAGQRARQRAAAAIRRNQTDAKLVEAMQKEILAQFPGCDPADARRVATHTAERGSGRVGRSEAGRRADAKAIKLAVIAHIRHEHTDYDQLLMQGVERQEARSMIQGGVQLKLDDWS